MYFSYENDFPIRLEKRANGKLKGRLQCLGLHYYSYNIKLDTDKVTRPMIAPIINLIKANAIVQYREIEREFLNK